MLGNPPWEIKKSRQGTWFARYVTGDIADKPGHACRAQDADRRAKAEPDPVRTAAWLSDTSHGDGEESLSSGMRGAFPLVCRGHMQHLSHLLNEINAPHSCRPRGQGRLRDSVRNCDRRHHYNSIFRICPPTHALVSLFDFENRQGIFPGVHRQLQVLSVDCRGFRQTKRTASGLRLLRAYAVEDLGERESARHTIYWPTSHLAAEPEHQLRARCFGMRSVTPRSTNAHLPRSQSESCEERDAEEIACVDVHGHETVLDSERLRRLGLCPDESQRQRAGGPSLRSQDVSACLIIAMVSSSMQTDARDDNLPDRSSIG